MCLSSWGGFGTLLSFVCLFIKIKAYDKNIVIFHWKCQRTEDRCQTRTCQTLVHMCSRWTKMKLLWKSNRNISRIDVWSRSMSPSRHKYKNYNKLFKRHRSIAMESGKGCNNKLNSINPISREWSLRSRTINKKSLISKMWEFVPRIGNNRQKSRSSISKR